MKPAVPPPPPSPPGARLRRRPPPHRFQVDGKSIAPLLLRGAALGAAPGGWRMSFLVEHYALVDWPAGYVVGRTRVNDCPANMCLSRVAYDRARHGHKHALRRDIEMTMVPVAISVYVISRGGPLIRIHRLKSGRS
jgi:hypothetical protein